MTSDARPAARTRTSAAGRVTLLLFCVAYGTNTSTPLLLLYRDSLSLGATQLAAVFGVYAAGLLPALLVAGPLSDRVGRRRVALPFVLLAAGASLLFLPAASAFPLLLAARFAQGLVSGAVFSVASAWLQDLADPDDPGRAVSRASLAMNGGFALGPLVAGLLGQFAPAPLAVPFLLHVAVVAVGLAVVARVRDVALPAASGPLVRIALPRRDRVAFLTVVAPTAVWVFALPSVGVTVLPLLLPEGRDPVAVVGLLAGVTLGAAAVVAPLGRRMGGWAGGVGAGLGALGYLLGTVGATGGRPVVVVAAGAVLGSGAGLCLTAGLSAAQRMAEPHTRGAVNAAFYACAYLGFAAPVLVSAAAQGGSPQGPLVGAAGVAVTAAAWLLLPRNRAVLGSGAGRTDGGRPRGGGPSSRRDDAR